MTIPDIKSITSKDQARQLAIDWQDWQSEKSLYMSEVGEWYEFFRLLGRKFDLINEFKENGIL